MVSSSVLTHALDIKQIEEGLSRIKSAMKKVKVLMALDAELHSDLEALLLENGSKQVSLWGINLYPQISGNDFIEFDSIINVRPSSSNRSRGVENEAVRKKIGAVVAKWVER